MITNVSNGAKFYTVAECCEKLGYTPEWFRMKCKRGLIKGAVKRRTEWIIPMTTIDHMVYNDPLKTDVNPPEIEAKTPTIEDL